MISLKRTDRTKPLALTLNSEYDRNVVTPVKRFYILTVIGKT